MFGRENGPTGQTRVPPLRQRSPEMEEVVSHKEHAERSGTVEKTRPKALWPDLQRKERQMQAARGWGARGRQEAECVAR